METSKDIEIKILKNNFIQCQRELYYTSAKLKVLEDKFKLLESVADENLKNADLAFTNKLLTSALEQSVGMLKYYKELSEK